MKTVVDCTTIDTQVHVTRAPDRNYVIPPSNLPVTAPHTQSAPHPVLTDGTAREPPTSPGAPCLSTRPPPRSDNGEISDV